MKNLHIGITAHCCGASRLIGCGQQSGGGGT